MEHRWGERLPMDVAVQVAVWPHASKPGRLIDLSVSGGAIQMRAADVRVATRLQVAFILPDGGRELAACSVPLISANVIRRFGDCIGVEWSELAPAPVRELLRIATTRTRRTIRGRGAAVREGVARDSLTPSVLEPGLLETAALDLGPSTQAFKTV